MSHWRSRDPRLGRIFRCRATKHAAELKTCGAGCGTLHAQIERGLRPRIEGSVALLRRMEASIVGCDDQLVHLRSVPCEMRPENIFQIYDEQRLVGEDADLYHNGDMLSALGVHVVNGWARAHP